jgi:hypothetical protein
MAQPQSDGQPTDRLPDQPPCELVLKKITDALRNDGDLSREEQNTLFTLALQGVTGSAWQAKDCPSRLFETLKKEMTCGLSTQVVAAGLFAGDRFLPAWQAELLERATPKCQEPLIVASQTSSKTSAAIARALLKWANRSEVEDGKMLAWLALGSHERVARKAAQSDIVNFIDQQIAHELARAKGQHHIDLLEAAGNGPCAGCIAHIVAATGDADPSTRRAALAALRFVDDKVHVERMCRAVTQDDSPTVREHLAWALRWSEKHAATRVGCLEKAARADQESLVRMSAVGSLTYLSGDMQSAYDAILGLRDDAPDDVQRAVIEHLHTSDGPTKTVTPRLDHLRDGMK